MATIHPITPGVGLPRKWTFERTNTERVAPAGTDNLRLFHTVAPQEVRQDRYICSNERIKSLSEVRRTGILLVIVRRFMSLLRSLGKIK